MLWAWASAGASSAASASFRRLPRQVQRPVAASLTMGGQAPVGVEPGAFPVSAGLTELFQRRREMPLSQLPLTAAVVDVSDLLLQAGQPHGVRQRRRRLIAGEGRPVLAGQRP